MVYRMCYIRNGKVRGQTFSKPNDREADRFAEWYVARMPGCTLLTVKPANDPHRLLFKPEIDKEVART